MQENRNITNLKNLTNGPAKLTQALEITKEHYGVDLTKNSKLSFRTIKNQKNVSRVFF